MGSVWISSPSAARRHGVYAYQQTPPKMVTAIGTAVAGYVAQFPWGPAQEVYVPSGTKDMLNTFAPAGMSRTGLGYLGLIGKAFPALHVVRAMAASGTGTATCELQANPGAQGTTIATVTLKYPGTAGNDVTCTVKNATDGNANHFDLDVKVSNSYGSTIDSFRNINFYGSPYTSVDCTKCVLVESVVKTSAGRPDTQSDVPCTGGLDGSIVAADYVGTQGTGDKGVALFEGDAQVRHVFNDSGFSGYQDMYTVNEGFVNHAEFMGDRVAYVNSTSGRTLAETKADQIAFRSAPSQRCVYMDPWVYVTDDTARAQRLVPPAAFGASVACQVSPSTSIAWKSPEVVSMLSAIDSLETDRGNGAADNTDAGILTIISEDTGGFAFEADVTTYAVTDPSNAQLTRTRMGDYIAVSTVKALKSFVDAPNVEVNQIAEKGMVKKFMDGLKKSQFTDPDHLPYVVDWSFGDIDAANSAEDIAGGQYTIPLEVQTGSAQSKIFLAVLIGNGVTVTKSS